MQFEVKCPHCGWTRSILDSLVANNQAIMCEQCEKPFRVRTTAASPAAPAAAASPLQSSGPPGGAFKAADATAAAPAPRSRTGQTPIIGKLLDSDHTPAAVESSSGGFGFWEPLLRRQSPTDPSLWLTGLVALGLTWIAYALLPSRADGNPYWVKLFNDRGWVPYAVVYLTCWSLAILALKLWKLRLQQQSLTYDLLPQQVSPDIDRGNIPVFRAHIRSLPLNPRRDFLVRRVLLALEHLEARGDVQHVGSVLQAQSEIDNARVDGSYTMLHVFIWAVPILGFIGTVVGISDAVAQFSGSLQGAADLDVIKTSLAGVTSGLAVAFDTTLVALVMSMVIMFPANSLQKAEQDLLNSIDQWGNDQLLQRLSTATTTAEPSRSAADVAAWQQGLEQSADRFLRQLRELLASAQGSFSGEIQGANGHAGGPPVHAALTGRFALAADATAAPATPREQRLEDALNRLAEIVSRQPGPSAGPDTTAVTPLSV